MDRVISRSIDEELNVCGLSWRVQNKNQQDNKSDKVYKWEEVKVITQRPDKNIYRIQFQDGFVKKVDRLGLIFKGENTVDQIKRVDNARFNKYKSEKLSIMDQFIKSEMPF